MTVMKKNRLVIVDGIRTPFCKAGTDLAALGADELGRIAVSALLAFLIDPPTYVSPFVMTSIFGGYLAYSVAVIWLVWSPVPSRPTTRP